MSQSTNRKSTGSHVIDGDIRVLSELIAGNVKALENSRREANRLAKRNERAERCIQALRSALNGRLDDDSRKLLSEVVVSCRRDKRLSDAGKERRIGAVESVAGNGRVLCYDLRQALSGLIAGLEQDVEANHEEIKSLEGGQKGHHHQLKSLERVVLAVEYAEASLNSSSDGIA